MEEIFRPVVKQIADVLCDLLRQAYKDGKHLEKVFLTGGFSGSSYLRRVLRQEVDKTNKEQHTNVNLVTLAGNRCNWSTALGALRRGDNKTHGPLRTLHMSIGVPRTIPWEPEPWRASGRPEVMEDATRTFCKIDKCWYIKGAIEWLITPVCSLLESVGHTI